MLTDLSFPSFIGALREFPDNFFLGGCGGLLDFVHCKIRLATFQSSAGMSLDKLSLGGNNFYVPRRPILCTALFLKCSEEIHYVSIGDGWEEVLVCNVPLPMPLEMMLHPSKPLRTAP
jgi:hypothetical protein